MTPQGRLPWRQLVYINLFWLGLNIRNNAVNVFTPYLVAKFVAPELQNTALGSIRMAGLVVAMLVQPAMGILSDRNTSPFGRRRPFIFTGTLLDLFFLGWVALAGNAWMLLAGVLLIQFSGNISHGPLQALIPDLVPEEQRGQASAVKSIFELLPIILVGLTIAQVLSQGKLYLAVGLAGLALLTIMLLTMLLVHEKPISQKPDVPLAPALLRVLGMLAGILLGALAGLAVGGLIGGLAGLGAWALGGFGGWDRPLLSVIIAAGSVAAMLTAVVAGVWAGTYITLGPQVRRQPSFTWWVVNRLMFLTAVTSILVFAPFFLMDTFGVNEETAAGMMGKLLYTAGACTLLAALPAAWLGNRFGQKRLVGLGGLGAALGTLILLGMAWLAPNPSPNPAPNPAMIYVAGLVIGVASGLFYPLNWALGTRLVPPEQAGRYLGVANLAGAGAGIVGAGLGGPVADTLNAYTPGLGYFVIFAAYGLLFLLSAVCLRGIKE